jgi:hypothetical protein
MSGEVHLLPRLGVGPNHVNIAFDSRRLLDPDAILGIHGSREMLCETNLEIGEACFLSGN